MGLQNEAFCYTSGKKSMDPPWFPGKKSSDLPPLNSWEKIEGPPLNFREKIKGPPPVNLVPPGHISIVRSLKHILRVISSPLSSESVNRYIIWCISVQLGTWGKLFLHNGNLHRNTLLWASEICFQIPPCYHRRYYPHMTDFEPLQK